MEPELLREGRFIDRKAGIPSVVDNEHLGKSAKPDSPRRLLDFITDVIALANMSYRHGKVARFLLGMDSEYNLVGVVNQSTKPKHLIGIDYSSEPDRERLFRECIEGDFRRAVREHGTPAEMTLVMLWEEVGGVLVAYLEIGAESGNPTPYRATRELTAGKKRLLKDQTRKRDGESNVPFTQQDDEFWRSYHFCPSIAGDKWRRYFNRLRGGQFARAADLPGYQEPRTVAGNLVTDEIEAFVANPGRSLLAIEGQAGTGKTKLLEQQVYGMATDAVPYLKQMSDERPPEARIPIVCELWRSHFRLRDDLAGVVMGSWNEAAVFLERLPPSSRELLSVPRSRWVLCLDAADDMNEASIENFYSPGLN